MRLVFVLDCRDPDRLASFWSEAIGYRVSTSAEPYVVLVPANGHGPELVLQRVGEPKTTKNRMHLDIRTDDARLGGPKPRGARRSEASTGRDRGRRLSMGGHGRPRGQRVLRVH